MDQRIGPYAILRLIREGGQGRVYLGYDERLCRQVAIKVHTLPRGRARRQQAISEARKAAGVNDSRVVQVYDLIESPEYLAIVMEYVPGCDLEDLIGRAQLSIPAIIRVGADLAAALAAAAQEKVVHGDVKAGNVLVTRQGRVKLADFGVARQAGVGAGAGGSPVALAPEQLQGAPADLRSDLFSLGCLLYRLLAGRHPFARGGAGPDSGKLRYGEPPALDKLYPGGEEIPPVLLKLLRDLLQKNPQDRPQDTHRVRSDLRAAASAFPLSRADSLAREARPWFRPESSDDIPLHIPGDLRRRGKSRLVRRGLELWVQGFRNLRLSTQILVTSAIPLSLLITYESLTAHYPPRIYFAPPVINTPVVPPYVDEFGDRWLMRTIYAAVETRTGPLQAKGAVDAAHFFVHLSDKAPQIAVNASLRCSEIVCVFFVSRRDSGGFRHQHALVPPELPRRDWEAVLAQSAAALFP